MKLRYSKLVLFDTEKFVFSTNCGQSKWLSNTTKYNDYNGI